MNVSIFCLLYVGSSERVVDTVKAESFLNHESFATARGTKNEEHIFVAILQALLEIKVMIFKGISPLEYRQSYMDRLK